MNKFNSHCVPCAALVLLVAVLQAATAYAQSPGSPDYSSDDYATVLVNVIDDGYIDYMRLHQHHMEDLERYLALIGEVGPTVTPEQFPTRDSRLAYWINAYNAVMLKRWLDAGAGNPEVVSAKPRVDDKTWFSQFKYRVDGRDMTLGQIEFDGVFEVSKDPRIHAALVCGAQSCPPLHIVPYSTDPQTLDAQLEAAAHGWVRQFDGLYIDEQGDVWMSDVFRYFADDFEAMGGMAGVIEAWVHDADPRKAAALEAARDDRINYQKWNWTVNHAGLPVDRAEDLTTEHYEKSAEDDQP